MAMTAADLLAGLKNAPAPAGEPAAAPAPSSPQETTTSGPGRVPTTRTTEEGQILTSDEANPSETSLLGRLAGNIGAAASERFGVAGAERLARGQSQGKLGATSDAIGAGTGAAIAGLAAAAPFTGGATLGPAAKLALAPAIGSVVEGVGNTLAPDSPVSKFLGTAAELVTGGAQALSGPGKAKAAGKALLETGRKGVALLRQGAQGELNYQKVGRALRQATQYTLGRIKKPLQGELDRIEGIAKGITIGPGQPGYQESGVLVSMADDLGVSIGKRPGAASTALDRIREATMAGKPVNGADVVEVREILRRKGGGAVNSLDPSAPVDAKLRNQIRGLATDTIRSFLDPRDAADYGTTLAQYAQNYERPASILRRLTNRETTAADAFKTVYGGSDPTVLQTAVDLGQRVPALHNRLRLGFLELLNEASGGFAENGTRAIDMLRKNRAAVAQTGLFTGPELDGLEMALRPGVSGRLSEALGHLRTRSVGSAIGALGTEGPAGLGAAGAGLAWMAGASPEVIMMTAIAGGAAGAIRTLAMSPPGSTAALAAARTVAKAVTDMGKQYAEMDPQDADFGDEAETAE